tara:strand:+ start:310 stop:561 length:252 start_codon:yes stop_codon:yes gene_type:complete
MAETLIKKTQSNKTSWTIEELDFILAASKDPRYMNVGNGTVNNQLIAKVTNRIFHGVVEVRTNESVRSQLSYLRNRHPLYSKR